MSCTNSGKGPHSDKTNNHEEKNSSLEYSELAINKNVPNTCLNLKIINRLQGFLNIKNLEPRSFEYWKASDFNKYMFPYEDLMNMEVSSTNDTYYKPTVLEIIGTGTNDYERLIKIAFIGNENKNNHLRAIYTFIIDTKDWKFKRVLEHNTKDWKKVKVGNIKYFNSPLREFNSQKAEKFNAFNNTLSAFFKESPRQITYFACTSPAELYKIMGYDYITNMYMAETGALNEYTSNIIFAGNDSEYYAHELVHSYLSPSYFKTINNLGVLSEGLATYIGGSNGKSYEELREDLRTLMAERDINLMEYLHPYYETQEKNQLSYTIGALLLERAIRLKGVEDFWQIFDNEDLEASLKLLDLDLETLNKTLEDELSRPINPASSILK